ncbi:hypothetical protein [Cellulomonas chengniuliangii]|uniref:Uncharacterized protein n=1 Tax=Cellulomonas chengniuliangii TaxID=2968084 RepID=A0ABY5KY90_9CELL|nr:hypothetical protein [Cellulomonas chengniuliangii]MCC2309963.1 hypothetical protein [Cellulomonas chengniuliangii]UUI74634.1 hypothetical protein NP064_12660 [Cellulomonas chengniuliangii]
MRRFRTATVATIAAAGLVLAAAPSMAAGSGADAGGGATSVVVGADALSPELESYLATLSDADRDAFIASSLPAEVVLTQGAQQPLDAAARRSLSAASASGRTVGILATGCWTARQNGSARSGLGNTLYTYYTVGGWCSSGSTVTSAWLADAGGETSTPGWSYQGRINSGSGVVSNTGRAYSQHRFTLSAGGATVQSPTPCVRVTGTSSGSASGSSSCGI